MDSYVELETEEVARMCKATIKWVENYRIRKHKKLVEELEAKTWVMRFFHVLEEGWDPEGIDGTYFKKLKVARALLCACSLSATTITVSVTDLSQIFNEE